MGMNRTSQTVQWRRGTKTVGMDGGNLIYNVHILQLVFYADRQTSTHHKVSKKMIVPSKDKATFERIFHASLSNNGSTSSCNLTTLSVATSWIEAKKARHFCDLLVQLRLFPGNLSSFLSLVNWKWNFGTRVPASSNRRTKKRFVNIPSAVSYVIITWAEAKILKEKTKWKVRVLKVFTLI